MARRMITGILSAFGILLLILDAKTALQGASDAIELCLGSVIPSIFPFLVLSGLLTSVISSSQSKILKPMGRLLGIPKGSEGIFLTGILGGYPTGAQAVHRAWKQGTLNTEDARRMLGFCSNAGPSFIFGILASIFPSIWMLWLLWGIHILSAILTAVILPCVMPQGSLLLKGQTMTLSQSLKASVVTMGYICGWIVLFRIVLAFCDRWVLWLLPSTLRVAVYGATELANGCCNLINISSVGQRFVVAGGMLAFGGICVAMQTLTITDGLGAGKYFPGKVLQMLISILLCCLAQMLLFAESDRWYISIQTLILPLIMIVMIAFWQRKQKKGVAFLQ